MRAAAAAVVLVLLAACEGGSPPVARKQAERRPARKATSRFERPATRRPGVVVRNHAFGPSRARVRRAVDDLRSTGYWDDLTGELHVVVVAARPGPENVPEDAHLADALLSAEFDRRGAGKLCDVMFFTEAIADDLERQRRYHAAGLSEEEPPTLRQFWAAILAHELAHCLGRGRGETAARRWEALVLGALTS